MDKREFLSLLQKSLAGLPQEDIDERLNFYSEMIDDSVEEGLTEEEAVARIGSVNEIAAQIIGDTPLPVPEPVTKQRNPWKIAVIILSSPIWFSLQISAAAVALSLYASLWAVIIAFWSVFAALCSCGFAGILGGIVMAVFENAIPGIALVGMSLVCCGLAVFTFYGCIAASKGTVLLTKKLARLIKKAFTKKEDA